MGADSPRPLGLRGIEALVVGAQDKGGGGHELVASPPLSY